MSGARAERFRFFCGEDFGAPRASAKVDRSKISNKTVAASTTLAGESPYGPPTQNGGGRKARPLRSVAEAFAFTVEKTRATG